VSKIIRFPIERALMTTLDRRLSKNEYAALLFYDEENKTAYAETTDGRAFGYARGNWFELVRNRRSEK
jgi:hypothetical protein